MRKFFTTILAAALLCTTVAPPAQAQSPVTIKIDGWEMISATVPPVLEQGRTLVDLPVLSKNLGFEYLWNQTLGIVVIDLPSGKHLRMTIGSPSYDADGQTWPLSVAPRLVNEQPMIPLRFLASELGYAIAWDEGTNTVLIETGRRASLGALRYPSEEQVAYLRWLQYTGQPELDRCERMVPADLDSAFAMDKNALGVKVRAAQICFARLAADTDDDSRWAVSPVYAPRGLTALHGTFHQVALTSSEMAAALSDTISESTNAGQLPTGDLRVKTLEAVASHYSRYTALLRQRYGHQVIQQRILDDYWLFHQRVDIPAATVNISLPADQTVTVQASDFLR